MKLVFLFGNCAVGKMTVGQALCDITRLKLFHNHMTIEPVIALFGDYKPRAVARISRRTGGRQNERSDFERTKRFVYSTVMIEPFQVSCRDAVN